MKKRVLAWVMVLGTMVGFPFFGANLQGSDGAQLGGGGCGRLEAPASDADSDGDGVADGLDNCPSFFNPHQTDLDGNGIGEVCEAIQAFDGIIDCPFPSCETGASCEEFLQQSCEEDAFELAFLEKGIACCDQVCVVFGDPGQDSVCPAGTCQAPSPHCSTDEECLEQDFEFCFEGCCVGEAIPVPCPCDCTPEEPECECPPCDFCPDGLPAPQCFEGEGCAPGDICSPGGCCVPEGEPPPPPI